MDSRSLLRRYVPKALWNRLRQIRSTTVIGSWLDRMFPYEPDMARAMKRIVQSGWVCADVGANVGHVTQLLARLIGPSGCVIAFEAHPENARLLRENIKIRGYAPRVRVENLAVSNGSQDRLWLHAGKESSPAEWNITGHDVDGNPTKPMLEVAAVSLDTYFPVGTRLDFVKIDVEGAEARVLMGMRRLLRETRPVIFLEFHNEAGWAGRAELITANYHLYKPDGVQINPADAQRPYHCYALPQERQLDVNVLQ